MQVLRPLVLQVAATYNLSVIDLYTALEGTTDRSACQQNTTGHCRFYSQDGLHPNDAGYAKIAAAVATTMGVPPTPAPTPTCNWWYEHWKLVIGVCIGAFGIYGLAGSVKRRSNAANRGGEFKIADASDLYTRGSAQGFLY